MKSELINLQIKEQFSIIKKTVEIKVKTHALESKPKNIVQYNILAFEKRKNEPTSFFKKLITTQSELGSYI